MSGSKLAETERWAVITGASSGIGRELAYAFAARGCHLFLIARNHPALQQVGAECATRFGVQTRVHAADLSNPQDVDAVLAALAGAPCAVEVLVNNAGFGVKGPFLETDIDREMQLVRVQLGAMLKLTKAVAPGMVARRTGRILNIASVYSFAPVPYQTVYAGCKAFVASFSAALREELKGAGVTVTVLCPGVTQTEFRSRAGIPEKSRHEGATAREVAEFAVRKTLEGGFLAVPGIENRLFVFLARHLPFSLFPRLMTVINNLRGVNAREPSEPLP